MTQYPLIGGVPLLQVTNVVFVCGWDHDSVSPYRRCPLTAGYKCSVCVAGTMTQYPLMGGVPLLQVTNVVFVCGWDHDSVSPYGRCPLTAGYKCSVCVWLGP